VSGKGLWAEMKVKMFQEEEEEDDPLTLEELEEMLHQALHNLHKVEL
jgi:hypothetical protein